MIVMQEMVSIDEVFNRLAHVGVNYNMKLPGSIGIEYKAFIKANIKSDF